MRDYYGKSYDVIYKNVKFKSFVELSDIRRSEKKYGPGFTLRYFGNDIAGDVEIDISAGHSEEREEFLKLAADTLKIM